MEEAPKKCFGGARQGREGAGGRGKERVAKVLESFLGRIKGEGEAKGLLNAWAAEMREKAWGKMAVAQPKRGDQR